MEMNGTEARGEEAVTLALSVAVTVISAIGLLLNVYILFIIVITKQVLYRHPHHHCHRPHHLRCWTVTQTPCVTTFVITWLNEIALYVNSIRSSICLFTGPIILQVKYLIKLGIQIFFQTFCVLCLVVVFQA